MNSHTIVFVCVVLGNTLNQKWRHPMQKIVTETHDFYIDNMPGKQFGFHNYPQAYPGFDWSECVGSIVDDAHVIEHEGYKWLQKASDK